MRKEQFDITGMTCSACSARVEKSVAKLPGIQEVSVNLLKTAWWHPMTKLHLTQGRLSRRWKRRGTEQSPRLGRASPPPSEQPLLSLLVNRQSAPPRRSMHR